MEKRAFWRLENLRSSKEKMRECLIVWERKVSWSPSARRTTGSYRTSSGIYLHQISAQLSLWFWSVSKSVSLTNFTYISDLILHNWTKLLLNTVTKLKMSFFRVMLRFGSNIKIYTKTQVQKEYYKKIHF